MSSIPVRMVDLYTITGRIKNGAKNLLSIIFQGIWWVASFSPLVGQAQSIDDAELLSFDADSFFQSYEGPLLGPLDSLEDILAIGQDLASTIRKTQRLAIYSDKYRVDRFLPDSNSLRLGADILSILPNSQVDTILNLRRILASYIRFSFDYTEDQAQLLAVLVTLYNGYHHQNVLYIVESYTQEIQEHLNSQTIGLPYSYEHWPGGAQILIPLALDENSQSNFNFDALQDPSFLQFFRQGPQATSLLPYFQRLFPDKLSNLLLKETYNNQQLELKLKKVPDKILIPSIISTHTLDPADIQVPIFTIGPNHFYKNFSTPLSEVLLLAETDQSIWETSNFVLNKDLLLGSWVDPLYTDNPDTLMHLVILSTTNDFQTVYISGLPLHSASLVLEAENTLLGLCFLDGYWYLSRLDADLNIIRMAPLKVEKDSYILVYEDQVKIQGLDQRIYTLDQSTLTIKDISTSP